jgi:hypothetical protein
MSDGGKSDMSFVGELASYAEDHGVSLYQWSVASGISVVRIREAMDDPLSITLEEAAALANSLGVGIFLLLSEGNPAEAIH